MEQATKDLIKADKIIKKRARYSCGLTSDEYRKEIGCGDFFFESPDGQNGQLFYELLNLGYRQSGFNAEYFWGVSKDGIRISYTEGDIYIKNLKK